MPLFVGASASLNSQKTSWVLLVRRFTSASSTFMVCLKEKKTTTFFLIAHQTAQKARCWYYVYQLKALTRNCHLLGSAVSISRRDTSMHALFVSLETLACPCVLFIAKALLTMNLYRVVSWCSIQAHSSRPLHRGALPERVNTFCPVHASFPLP